jgi:DNA-binding MarR family transcriptional regulator
MPRPSPPSADSTDTATRVWAAMQAFVTGEDRDRRREMREAFDIGRGIGRVAVLLKLADGPLTMGELAESQHIDPPNATVIVDKLESRGLVARTPHPEGNRRKLVALTDAGREAAARAGEIHARPPDALTGLPPEELAALERILSQLRSVIQEKDLLE